MTAPEQTNFIKALETIDTRLASLASPIESRKLCNGAHNLPSFIIFYAFTDSTGSHPTADYTIARMHDANNHRIWKITPVPEHPQWRIRTQYDICAPLGELSLVTYHTGYVNPGIQTVLSDSDSILTNVSALSRELQLAPLEREQTAEQRFRDAILYRPSNISNQPQHDNINNVLPFRPRVTK